MLLMPRPAAAILYLCLGRTRLCFPGMFFETHLPAVETVGLYSGEGLKAVRS